MPPTTGGDLRIAWQIVITAATGDLSFDDGAGPYLASVPAGTYHWRGDGSAGCLMTALGTAMDVAAGAAPGTYAWDWAGQAGQIGISFAALPPHDLLWAAAATTLDPELFGFAAVNLIGVAAATSAFHVQRTWFARETVVLDTGDLPIPDTRLQVARDGTCYGQQWGEAWRRTVGVALVQPEQIRGELEDAAPGVGWQRALIAEAAGMERLSEAMRRGDVLEVCLDHEGDPGGVGSYLATLRLAQEPHPEVQTARPRLYRVELDLARWVP